MITKAAYDFDAKRRQYATYEMAALRFAARDIVETINAWRAGGGYHPNEGWYYDDLATVKEEIHRRLSTGACPTCGK